MFFLPYSCVYKEDGGIRWRNCPFGLVVKYNFKFNIFSIKYIWYVIMQVYKMVISNYIQFEIFQKDKKKK